MFYPRKAILIYSTEQKSEYYSEIHDIDKNGEFLAGRPLNVDEIVAFDKIVKEEATTSVSECFPYRHIIAYKKSALKETVAWIYPAGKRHLNYKNKSMKSTDYKIPNLIFISDGSTTMVYAIKQKDLMNLKPSTQLYHAPFMNVYADGRLCRGSAKIDKFKNATEMIQKIELMFFRSHFTHTSHDNVVKCKKFETAYKNQRSGFNEDYLVSSIKLKALWG